MQEDITPLRDFAPLLYMHSCTVKCLALARCGCLPEPLQCCASHARAYAACEQQMSALTRSSGG